MMRTWKNWLLTTAVLSLSTTSFANDHQCRPTPTGMAFVKGGCTDYFMIETMDFTSGKTTRWRWNQSTDLNHVCQFEKQYPTLATSGNTLTFALCGHHNYALHLLQIDLSVQGGDQNMRTISIQSGFNSREECRSRADSVNKTLLRDAI